MDIGLKNFWRKFNRTKRSPGQPWQWIPWATSLPKKVPVPLFNTNQCQQFVKAHAFHEWLGEENAKAGQELWMYLCKILPLIRHPLTTLGICKEIQLQQSYSQIPSITLKPGLDTIP